MKDFKSDKKTHSNIKMGNEIDLKKHLPDSTASTAFSPKKLDEPQIITKSRSIAKTMKKTNFAFGFRPEPLIRKA